jgi:dipeptidyl aminopeptidase/acylaminoacyl peptidase
MKIRLSLIAAILICSILVFTPPASTTQGQTKRGLLPTDLSAIKDVSDAQISPDGSRVVYVVSEVTPDRSRTISRLWTVPATGGEPKRLLNGDASESTPRWSPDGKWIAFYSSRDKQDGLWVVAADGGEPKLATRVIHTNFFLTKAGENFTWSPDSKQIAFLSSPEVLSQRAPTEGTTPLQQSGVPAQVLRPLSREEIEKLPVEVREMIFRAQGQAMGVRPTSPIENALSALPEDPRVITRLQYKSRTAFSDNLQSHIFTVDLATRELRQITTGLYYEHSINWSPKGDEIVFVSNHEPEPDRVNNTDLFTVNVSNFAIRQLTKTKGCEWQPVFSPDGSQIAYLATKRPITTIDSVAEDSHAFIISAQEGRPIELNKGLDRRVSSIKWPYGKSPFLHFTDQGRSCLESVRDNGKREHRICFRGQVANFSISRNLDIAYLISIPTGPAKLEVLTPFDRTAYVRNHGPIYGLVVLPTFEGPIIFRSENDTLISSLKPSQPIGLQFNNEGFEIQGWLLPPVSFTESPGGATLLKLFELQDQLNDTQRTYGNEHLHAKTLRLQIDQIKEQIAIENASGKLTDYPKFPLILNIHGGPHGMHGYGFNANAQALAAQGYAVLLINPRGSSGYGQKFADGCINDWGGGDYRDLMKGVDVALEKFPFLDKDQMGVMGGSYGGYMTNWVVTQTDRFKAAVASASLSNLISFYSTSLYQDLIHAEFSGPSGNMPWDNFDLLWDRSPLKHIKKAKTPLLLLHGEQDNDVHITQAEEMYTALRMRGVDSVMVRYSREGHGLREPRHREDSLARTIQWFDRYLKK